MNKITHLFLLLNVVFFAACNKTEPEIKSELLGVWIAPAPYSDDIFYRPNLIASITPDRMTIYEDVANPTDFTWEEKNNVISYANEDQKHQLKIIEKKKNKMKILLENGDSLPFFRLSANSNTTFTDTDIFNLLYTQTFEIIVSDLNWQFRQLVFLPDNKFIKYEQKTGAETPNFYVGNWQLLVVNNQYFLFLHNLQDEKPLLIYLTAFFEFNIKGKMAYTNNLHPVEIKTIGTEADLALIAEAVIGDWRKPNYQFNTDFTFSAIAESDTLTGNWELNSTGEIVILKKDKNQTLQFGFLNKENQAMTIQYLADFHNEYASETIKKQ
jgi:hypothetical protein